MNIERILEKYEIEAALEKGQDKAKDALDRGLDEKSLRSEYYRAVKAANAFLDNFDKRNFERRGHKEAEDSYLRMMLLGAFQAVQMVGDLQAALNKSSTKVVPAHSYLQNKIPKATTVFCSNGESDIPVPCSIASVSRFPGCATDTIKFRPNLPQAVA